KCYSGGSRLGGRGVAVEKLGRSTADNFSALSAAFNRALNKGGKKKKKKKRGWRKKPVSKR
ncbi:hypothetical protein KAR91_79695, partial [Candidatus Pacearchaeota archaeon]|nr:hypothetical protein [Candidatus Pacearchaeota archaeon]